MENIEADVLKGMASLEYNKEIKDELLELVESNDLSIAFEVDYNHSIKFTESFAEYPVTRPHTMINAIDPKEEARKKENNRLFKLEHGL